MDGRGVPRAGRIVLIVRLHGNVPPRVKIQPGFPKLMGREKRETILEKDQERQYDKKSSFGAGPETGKFFPSQTAANTFLPKHHFPASLYSFPGLLRDHCGAHDDDGLPVAPAAGICVS